MSQKQQETQQSVEAPVLEQKKGGQVSLDKSIEKLPVTEVLIYWKHH